MTDESGGPDAPRPLRHDQSATRDVWACPNGHKDWDRRSTAMVGKSVEFTCHVCKAVWNATPQQRAAVLRHLAGARR
jgi:hypothetical protein